MILLFHFTYSTISSSEKPIVSCVINSYAKSLLRTVLDKQLIFHQLAIVWELLCLCVSIFSIHLFLLFCSGSRSGFIHHHDVRVAEHLVGKLGGHTQEVCGLQWSPDGRYLASGGNDNVLNLWSNQMATTADTQPLYAFTQHQAAVKVSLLGTLYRMIYQWLSARLWKLQCVSNGFAAVLHWAIIIE